MSEEKTCRRIHIGNISPKLKDNSDALSTRLAKFGSILRPLEFHTKPVSDFYFAYVDMELDDKAFEKLKTSLNGILYMGRKITIGLAKAGFPQSWQKDNGRPSPSTKELRAKSGIALARESRIKEASGSGPCNSITGAPIVKTSLIGANNSSLGYSKSAHTFNDMSANTKNKSPSHSLVGQNSYGSSLVPKTSFTHQYSWFSGHGDVVKGRVRKTARPAAYFLRKQQTMRLLINGELKQIKCYKTKLWGVEKKSALDLTFRYVDGTWRSGDDHVVERLMNTPKQVLEYAPEKCGISGDQAQVYGTSLQTTTSIPETKEDTESNDVINEEQAKNASVLAKLFNTYDFNKQTEMETDDISDEDAVTYDSKGRKTVQRFDFETQGALPLQDSDNEGDDIDNDGEMAIVEEFKTSTERPPEEVYYSESDEGNEIDMDALQQSYTTEAIKTQYDEEHDAESDTMEIDSAEKAPVEEVGENVESSEEKEESEETEETEESEKPEESDQSQEEPAETQEQDVMNSDTSSSSESSESESDSSSSSSSSESEAEADEQDVSASDSEEDLMPKFSAPATTNTTENLRSLFNQGESSQGFSLAVPEDDIDESKQAEEEAERQKLLEQIKQKQEAERENQEQRLTDRRKFGLFWSHFESPFLQTQTQLSKIGHLGQKFKLPGEKEDEESERVDGEEDDYEKWFWSVRGEIGRECKKRRREVTRNMKKRSVKAYV